MSTTTSEDEEDEWDFDDIPWEKAEFAKAMSKATGKPLDSFKNLTADEIQATLNNRKNFIAGMPADEFRELDNVDRFKREEAFRIVTDYCFPEGKNIRIVQRNIVRKN